MLSRQLRFRDLKDRGIVDNRVTLGNWITNYGFPRGRLVGNTRLWAEDQIVEWLAAQPVDPKRTPLSSRSRQIRADCDGKAA